VHSGFCGRLALEIVNLSNDRHPITIKKGDHFMHMEFITREGKPSPYEGEFQFQYMSKDEINIYLPILRKAIPDFEALSKIWLKKNRKIRTESREQPRHEAVAFEELRNVHTVPAHHFLLQH
jgi:hypothetical protein